MLHKHGKLKTLQKKMDDLAGRMKKLGDDEPELVEFNGEWEGLKRQAMDLQVELCKGSTMFPENVTFWNFADYLLVPSLVYELEYPRTDR